MKRNTMIGWTEREFSAAADLSQEVGARELLAVVLEEVLAVGPGAWSSGEKLPEFRPQMMLTLVTYAYSVGIYGSRDLEDAMDTDPTIRYICARSFPDWVSIRRFRRRNRDLVELCHKWFIRQTPTGERIGLAMNAQLTEIFRTLGVED